mgnify:FL=1
MCVHAEGGAALGTGPAFTQWQISHCAGGGFEDIRFRVHNADELWAEALARTAQPEMVG